MLGLTPAEQGFLLRSIVFTALLTVSVLLTRLPVDESGITCIAHSVYL